MILFELNPACKIEILGKELSNQEHIAAFDTIADGPTPDILFHSHTNALTQIWCNKASEGAGQTNNYRI